MASSKKAAEEFVKRWTGKGNEEQDKHLYWIGLFQDVLGLTDALDRLKFEQPVHTKASEHQGFIDVLIPTASVIVEQKGIGHDLSKAEVRQGRKVTPAQQALAYTEGLPLSQKPRYVIASNFAEMWVYDTERDPLCKGEPLIIKLADLPKNLPAIQFLAGKGQAPETIQRAVSVEAGRIMGRIHEAVAKSFESAGFDRNDETTHHAISAFCCRVMFLMFCEDEAGLIPQNAFRNYVQHFPADYLRNALRDLFERRPLLRAHRHPHALRGPAHHHHRGWLPGVRLVRGQPHGLRIHLRGQPLPRPEARWGYALHQPREHPQGHRPALPRRPRGRLHGGLREAPCGWCPHQGARGPAREAREHLDLRKLHYVFDTDCGGIMARARFWSKKGSFEPSCEVNRNMLKSGLLPAVFMY